MVDALLLAKLTELAAAAEVTRIKAERGQHWDRELAQECARLANLSKDVSQMASGKD